MSFRNNKDRLGPPPGDTSPPPTDTVQSPDAAAPPQPMAFSTPTEFVDLPSLGKFYGAGHPLHDCESVEIRYMTAKEEDILTSKTLAKKGLTIDRLLSSVIVNGNIKPEELLVGDRNALIVATRVTGYGEEYETRVKCPSCDGNSKYSFNLSDANIFHGGATSENEDVTATENGTFTVEAPHTKATVEMRLLTGKDEKLLARAEETRKRKKMVETLTTSSLRMFIISVNGNQDPYYIDSFIANAPAADARYIREAYKTVVPNIDLTQYYECQACGHEQEMEVPFTSDFFWPG